MADNATANPGAGGVIFATDDIGGVHWPFTKQAFGPRDTATEVEDLDTKRLPVKVGDPLPAGTNTLGAVDVTDEPGRDLGKVDIASLDQYTPVAGRLPVDGSGVTLTVQETHPATATVTVPDFALINDATRVLTILAANASRRSAMVRNETDYAIPLKEGTVPSPLSYTDVLPPGGVYRLEYPACTAAITGFFDRIPSGRLLVTERT